MRIIKHFKIGQKMYMWKNRRQVGCFMWNGNGWEEIE